MEYAIVTVPAAPVRRKPAHRREMVNQLLFGETVKVLKEKNERWVRVRSLHDGYEGWVTRNLLSETDEALAHTRSPYVAADLLSLLVADDIRMSIPVGSSLPGLENGMVRLAGMDYAYSGSILKRDGRPVDGALIRELAMPWLNAPYLWGGRTPLGVDCSGFVQVVFKMAGIDLPRDAWQQAQEGNPVKPFRDARAGDLAFFDRGEEIVHVGILVGDNRVIHASGQVRIDILNKKGIADPVTGKRSLRLRALRRVF